MAGVPAIRPDAGNQVFRQPRGRERLPAFTNRQTVRQKTPGNRNTSSHNKNIIISNLHYDSVT